MFQVAVAEVMSEEVRESVFIPLLERCLADKSRWVQESEKPDPHFTDHTDHFQEARENCTPTPIVSGAKWCL